MHDATDEQAAGVSTEFQGLGFLPGQSSSDDRSSRANAVSADGRVVVGVGENRNGRTEAFRWSEGTMIGLGTAGDAPATIGSADGVSADGSVIVGWRRDSGGRTRAYRWTGDAGAFLGVAPNYGSTVATAVSADGSVIVGRNDAIDQPTSQAVRLDGESIVFLTDPNDSSDGRSSAATGVSADGSVIVGFMEASGEEPTGRTQAVRWTGETMVGLGFLSNPTDPNDFAFSVASGVSADGAVIVGESANSAGHFEAFRWSDGSMVGLGVPPQDSSSAVPGSRALGVSADGSVVVGYYNAWEFASCMQRPSFLGMNFPPDCSVTRAFIWTADRGLRSLEHELIVERGLTGAIVDWRLRSATAVSADGSTIVGYGINPDGQTEAWRVVLGRLP